MKHFKSYNKIFHAFFCMAILFNLIACNSSTSSSGTSTTNGPASASAAAASMFSSGGSSSISVPSSALSLALEVALTEGECEDDAGCTCSTVESDDDPSQVDSELYGDAGTYGSDSSSITVTVDDFCGQSDGTENSGDGPDSNGRFAAFSLNDDIEGSCEESDGSTTTITMKSGSSGIWRNTSDYYPEIYGTFTMEVDGEEFLVDCTIYLDENESVAEASCTDENGDTIEQDSSASCEFSTDE